MDEILDDIISIFNLTRQDTSIPALKMAIKMAMDKQREIDETRIHRGELNESND